MKGGGGKDPIQRKDEHPKTRDKNSYQIATGEMMYIRGVVNPWIVLRFSQISYHLMIKSMETDRSTETADVGNKFVTRNLRIYGYACSD